MYLANFFFEFLLFEALDFDDQIILFCCFIFYTFQIDSLSNLLFEKRKKVICHLEKK